MAKVMWGTRAAFLARARPELGYDQVVLYVKVSDHGDVELRHFALQERGIGLKTESADRDASGAPFKGHGEAFMNAKVCIVSPNFFCSGEPEAGIMQAKWTEVRMFPQPFHMTEVFP